MTTCKHGTSSIAWTSGKHPRAYEHTCTACLVEAGHPADKEQRLSVTLDEIDEQRAKGWPDFHPEDFCHRCGGKNVRSWYVDSDRFNAALGPDPHPYNGIVCPGCFVELHEQATGLGTTWKLIPDPQQAFRPTGGSDG